MESASVTSEQAADCLRILKAATEPMVAADIAARLGLGGSHETRRRKVRAIVQRLRDGDEMIVATNNQGYWLTKDMQLWRDYLADRVIDAKRVLADAHRKKGKAADAKGQGLLFGPQRVAVGCATMEVT